jgi:hypothetical protein
MRRIAIVPEPPGSLWEEGRLIKPGDLPISDQLRESLRQWDKQYNSMLFDPNFDPSSSDADVKADWAAFDTTGVAIWKSLQRELSGSWQLRFYSHRFREGFEDPNELAQLLAGDPSA